MFAAAGRQPQRAIERHDEGERLGALCGLSTPEPTGEMTWRLDDGNIRVPPRIAQFGGPDVAVHPGLRHADRISMRIATGNGRSQAGARIAADQCVESC